MSGREEAGYEAIRVWLSRRCGITFPEHKGELLRQRLSRVKRAYDLPSLADIAIRLNASGAHELELAVMHAASTNHTYFCREPDVLDAFRSLVLPALEGRDEIRIWSAACSSGDEAYTIAMLIAETLGSEALARTQILGTDISAPMVEQAEKGVYSRRHLEFVPDAMLRRWFVPLGGGAFRVAPEIGAACTFRRMNLKTRPYPFRKPFQVIFCRNVLYYFDREDQAATLEAMWQATEPGGWLVTSVSENVRDHAVGWRTLSGGLNRKVAP
ncbi:protein-glutamate O-methyltransferase CheR [Cereibacter sphaeroides]|uniref:CheR family methyltransferase n=1 Tax=Rhodobacterales TaxID=204455 RepID=UPI000BBE4433|nr:MULTISPECIES: protein-glutamate O-methyltransferase CheR [Paracoccaceae]MCE6952977.1 protein-glutamate O-methyltransferase CheR [Cereibacter sphaeroides]MCE6961925.1 protein-glutamate O-methyltransferase CheR [Cereibacter sphaeroides]MCE6970700.1 protein-glutamate O-methyltransferase CheR [Cereibacter sphaeroides]MCE6975704.1 protein-glutamate O-methyltransferase CheR [Cereibacter sphaeroides]